MIIIFVIIIIIAIIIVAFRSVYLYVLIDGLVELKATILDQK